MLWRRAARLWTPPAPLSKPRGRQNAERGRQRRRKKKGGGGGEEDTSRWIRFPHHLSRPSCKRAHAFRSACTPPHSARAPASPAVFQLCREDVRPRSFLAHTALMCPCVCIRVRVRVVRTPMCMALSTQVCFVFWRCLRILRWIPRLGDTPELFYVSYLHVIDFYTEAWAD